MLSEDRVSAKKASQVAVSHEPCYHFKETYKMEVLSEDVVGAKTATTVTTMDAEALQVFLRQPGMHVSECRGGLRNNPRIPVLRGVVS